MVDYRAMLAIENRGNLESALDFMRAFSVIGPGKIAIHAKYAKSGRPIVSSQPAIDSVCSSDGFPMKIPIVVYVVDRQKLIP